MKNMAKMATNSFPTQQQELNFLFADLIVTAPIANPRAVSRPNKSPNIFPNCKES